MHEGLSITSNEKYKEKRSKPKMNVMKGMIHEIEENAERRVRLIRREKEELEKEVDKLKEQCKKSARKEKETGQELKDLREGIEKKKGKIIELEGKVHRA